VDKVGIPKAMYYFEYWNVWTRFFEELGFETILSGDTDDEIVSEGIRYASSDLCFPVKAAFGHIKRLLDGDMTPDYIFLPEIRKTDGRCFTCPKAIGLPAMIKNTFPDWADRIISPVFNGDMKKLLIKTGEMLGCGKGRCVKAYSEAREEQKAHEPPQRRRTYTAAVIGHSYLLKDRRLNMNIIETLYNMDVGTVTADTVPQKTITNNAKGAGYKRPFWHSANGALGFTKYIVDNKAADGVILLSSFGCGTDPLTEDFCRDYLREHGNIPFVSLSLDEHTGGAGINTRLEAFKDCMEAKRK